MPSGAKDNVIPVDFRPVRDVEIYVCGCGGVAFYLLALTNEVCCGECQCIQDGFKLTPPERFSNA